MLLQADAAVIPLADKSVHCCIISPPYWGLRKYLGDQTVGLFPDLGLEKTPEEHIERMVVIFREVRRVLRDDGVVWLNLGDSYSGSGGPGSQYDDKRGIGFRENFEKYDNPNRRVRNLPGGNLMLMPHRVAIALQSDGWIVRNDLVWWKRNPMPESVNGWRWENGNLRKGSWRHTRSHEYVFQLVKQMGYYSNQEAVREANTEIVHRQDATPNMSAVREKKKDSGDDKTFVLPVRYTNPSGRNPRSVLDVPTAAWKGAHYATFPPKLIAPLIRASCPRRSCPECGAPYAPVVEKSFHPQDDVSADKGIRGHEGQKCMDQSSDWQGFPRGISSANVFGYRPTCEHTGEPVAGIVLDIFGGSGTTGMVARELQRRWVVMDISRPYMDEQAKVRTKSGSPANVLEGLPLFAGESGNTL